MQPAPISEQLPNTDEWEILSLRQVAWEEIEALQRRLVADVQAHPYRRYTLVCEPRPVFTAGISAKATECLWSAVECEARGIEIATVNRGGKWTYHGPGQIVLFPLVHLENLGLARRETKKFIAVLQAAVLDFLSNLGVTALASEKSAGIFVDNQKLCSIGIRVIDGVCTHGIAVYTEPQKNFAGIHPCGVTNQKVTSLTELGIRADWEALALDLALHVENSFKTLKN